MVLLGRLGISIKKGTCPAGGKKSLYDQWAEKEEIPIYLAYRGTDLAAITDRGRENAWADDVTFLINQDTWKGMCDAYLRESAGKRRAGNGQIISLQARRAG